MALYYKIGTRIDRWWLMSGKDARCENHPVLCILLHARCGRGRYYIMKMCHDSKSYIIVLGKRQCVKWLLAWGKDCVPQGGERKRKRQGTCGFWDTFKRNPRGNRNITLNYYVIYLNIFIKHNIYRYFVYGCVCLRVRRYCGCAAVDRPQPQARVVEATIRRLFILLHDGVKGGRGTVYAAVWKQDVAGRSAAGENRWSPTFGCCAPMHRHISEFRGTYMV